MGGPKPRPVTQRFWEKFVRPDDPDACWVWTSRLIWNGYGTFYVSAAKKSVLAHRFSYELLVGPIPEGLQIDHLCRVRACVNPAHLEPVTQQENIRRGTAAEQQRARFAARTHCKNGHELTPDNVYLWKRGNFTTRNCRKCRLDASRAYEQHRPHRPYAPRRKRSVEAERELVAEPFADAP